jgi:ABC-type spermidine/putrescine transport system permease subunit I
MAQTLINQRKSTEWTRALIGGGLSALIIAIALFLLSFTTPSSSVIKLYLNLTIGLPGIFLHTWLLGDPFAQLLSPADALAGTWRIVYLTLVYWFVAGFGITYFIKDNRKAIQTWLIMLAILAVLVIFLEYLA